jgi:hypothetical protein
MNVVKRCRNKADWHVISYLDEHGNKLFSWTLDARGRLVDKPPQRRRRFPKWTGVGPNPLALPYLWKPRPAIVPELPSQSSNGCISSIPPAIVEKVHMVDPDKLTLASDPFEDICGQWEEKMSERDWIGMLFGRCGEEGEDNGGFGL